MIGSPSSLTGNCLHFVLDTGNGCGDLASHEVQRTTRALVVEEDAAAGVHTVGLAIALHHHVGIGFGDAVGVIRIHRRRFVGALAIDAAPDLAAGGLVDPGLWRVNAS